MTAEYPSAIWSPSPNHSPRGREPDRVVIHITDGTPHLPTCVEHLRDRESRVSAHFVVGQKGEVVQLVRLADRAWHAGAANARSIGIEHCARTPGELDRLWPRLTMAKRRLLVADPALAESPTDPGLPLTEPQLLASARLVRWLCERYGWPVDSEHIGPHCEVPGTTHIDCGLDVERGGSWPWRRYWQMLRP